MEEKEKTQPTVVEVAKPRKKKKPLKRTQRPSIIDDHPQKEKIIKDILTQVPYLQIKKKYNLSSVDVVKRFVENRLIPSAASHMSKSREETSKDIMSYLDNIQSYLSKIINAADEWLSDPDRPDRYFMGDRSEELMVVYVRPAKEGGKVEKRKARLQDLIDEVFRSDEYSDCAVQYVQTSRQDTRRIMLDALRLAQQQVELIARITGQMHDIVLSVDVYGVVIPQVVKIIVDATEGHCEIQDRILRQLEFMLQEKEAEKV